MEIIAERIGRPCEVGAGLNEGMQTICCSQGPEDRPLHEGWSRQIARAAYPLPKLLSKAVVIGQASERAPPDERRKPGTYLAQCRRDSEQVEPKASSKVIPSQGGTDAGRQNQTTLASCPVHPSILWRCATGAAPGMRWGGAAPPRRLYAAR